MSLKLKCVARGPTSMTDAFDKLDPTLVQFVLIKFPIGSGTFKRNKYIYVHWVGEACGAVKRGKWNSETPKVLERFGTTHAGMEESNIATLKDFEAIVTRLKKIFVSDDGSFSLAKLKEEYENRLKEEMLSPKNKHAAKDDDEGQEDEEEEVVEPTSPIRKRKLAKELGLNAESVLKAINHDDFGPFNWCLFEPNPAKLTLVEAGSNGVFELLEQCPEDKVYFGVVRLAFGIGRFRRTKRIFFQWSGEKIGAVTKGKANACYGDMMGKLGPVNCDLHLNGSEDKSLDAILAKVSHVFVVDNIKCAEVEKKATTTTTTTTPEGGKDANGGVNQQAYIEALLEEQKVAAKFYNEPEDLETDFEKAAKSPGGSKCKRGPQAPVEFDVDETVKLIHLDEGGLMWGVFQF